MNSSSLTRLAVLGTISDLHRQPLPYDLACLRKLVAERAPDLLCAEITPQAWEQGDLSQAELEVREALAPMEAATDIVLVPVAPSLKSYPEFTPKTGLRRSVAQAGLKALRWGQQKAGTPEAIHGFLFGAFCHTVCTLSEAAWTPDERDAWEQQNREMVENILKAVRRDPGRRVLLVVQCQRQHRLLPLLRRLRNGLEIVPYHKL